MRFGLFTYVEALLRSPKQKSNQFFLMLSCYLVFGISAYFAIASTNFIVMGLTFASGLVYISGVISGVVYFNNKPNLIALMPLSPRKSLLYRFLSVLILFLIVTAGVVIFFSVISLITAVLTFIINSSNAGDISDDAEFIETMAPMGVHGGIFTAVYFVFMYGSGMISGFIKKRKYATYFVLGQCAVVLVGMILMGNPFIQESYDKMGVPWLCTALCCISALAVLGVAIYMGIKQSRKTY